MNHLMIDLETLGHSPDAMILSIGMVKFNAEGQFLAQWGRNLQLSTQRGRLLDESTLMWWLEQSEAARKSISAPKEPRIPLTQALARLTSLFAEDESMQVWSNGASFDVPMLEHAYSQHLLPVPWKFWNIRCYRTVKALNRDVKMAEGETAHIALDDAKAQALHLIAIHRQKGGIL